MDPVARARIGTIIAGAAGIAAFILALVGQMDIKVAACLIALAVAYVL